MVTLDKLGKLVIGAIRDAPLRHFDWLLSGHDKSDSAKKIRSDLGDLNPIQASALRGAVAACLDDALHEFLKKLQEAHDFKEGVELIIDGSNAAEKSSELNAELFGNNGWIARFSKYPPSDL